MPKKQEQISQAEQSERFRKAAEELAEDGGLSPTEAEERFNQAMKQIARHAPTAEEDR